MVRRITLALLMLTLTLPACGRQVTPSGTSQPGSNSLAGEMEIKFRTFGAMDFTNTNYVIVFNTSGVGGEPYANVFATTGCDYSFVFAVGPTYGGGASVSLYQVFIPPGSARLAFNQITLAPGTTNFRPNADGKNTEFDLTFARSQFNVPAPVSGAVNACGNTATPAPGTSASPSANSSPSPVASSAPTPSATATSASQSTWFINFFTTNAAGAPLDALGFGVNDVSFTLPINVNANVDQQIFRQAGVIPPSSASAYIAGGEIITIP